MKELDFKNLEALIGKLSQHLGKPVCIINSIIQDGFHVGTYDTNGDHDFSGTGHTLEHAVNDLIKNSKS